VAGFYQQTGMDFNADISNTAYSSEPLTKLELAHGAADPALLEQLLEAGVFVKDNIRLKLGCSEAEHLSWVGPATANMIADYRAQRACLPCGFAPYDLLHETLQLDLPLSANTRDASTTTTTSIPSGSSLAQAALKSVCHALVDGRYSAAAVDTLIHRIGMLPDYAPAMVQALSLAQALGHYGAGLGVRASQLDQGIRVALSDAGLWEAYLRCKAQFETLQGNIDRYQADGSTLLTAAAANGELRMISVLAELGAKVNDPDAHGNYPLTAAARARNPAACSALLSLGANPGTTDLQKRSMLIHVADWLSQTDISDTAGVAEIAGLIEQLLNLGYDLRQPIPKDHAAHAAYPTVADLLCKPENAVKLALLGPERTAILVQAILANVGRRGSQPCLN
jgi:hypothetical protein